MLIYEEDMVIAGGSWNKKHPANQRSPKKTTTFVLTSVFVTHMRKFPIIQYTVSDSRHSTK